MASAFESLVMIILFTLLVKGHCQCGLENITVGTEKTSRQIQGKQEWHVKFINSCSCSQLELTVSCDGYQSVEQVDPNVFAPIGDHKCIVNGGEPIAPFRVVEFLYAWDSPFVFVPVSSQIACS